MGWLFPRLLRATLTVVAAGLVGWLVGRAWHLPLLGLLVGAVLGSQIVENFVLMAMFHAGQPIPAPVF